MKNYIRISGGISGNGILERALGRRAIDFKQENYGIRYFLYTTIEEAKQDLKEAYTALKEDEPDYDGVCLGYKNEALIYDASIAKIVRGNF